MTISHSPPSSSPAPQDFLAIHAQSYHRFMLGVKWSAIHLAALVVSLVLWFCTPAGFVWGLVGGFIVFAGGVYAMTHGLAHSTENDNAVVAEAHSPHKT